MDDNSCDLSDQFENSSTVNFPESYLSYNFSKLEYKDISLNYNIPPIPKLDYPNIHYRCPKCYNFPLIEFINENEKIIRYSCACYKNKVIKIEELFQKEKNYMSFIDTISLNDTNDANDSKKEEIIGFRCTEHKLMGNNKFKYYCVNHCQNLCKNCIKKHLDDGCNLIVFDYENFEAYKKINEILKFGNEREEEKKNEIENFSGSDNENENKINLNISEISGEEEAKDKKINDNNIIIMEKNNCKSMPKKDYEIMKKNFNNLINIIINDYLNYPNYFHFVNIDNIYRILIKENKNKNDEKSKDNDPLIALIYIIDNFKTILRYRISDRFIEVHKHLFDKVYPIKREFKFYYNGYELDEYNKIGETISEEDKERKAMKIIAKEITEIDEIDDIKEIKCPICSKNIFINFDKYKINLKCVCGHNKNKILFNDFMRTQKSHKHDSYLYCSICHKYLEKMESFYKCFSCRQILCDLCKEKHDKSHQIVDYNEINYICKEHNGVYQKYCIQDKKNICIDCEKDHKNHDFIILKDNIPKKQDILKNIENFKKNFEKLKRFIKKITTKFNIIINNLEIYQKIYENIAKSFNNTIYKNYQVIDNIIEFEKYTYKISEDINQITNIIDISEKFKYLMNIFDQMSSNNYIIGEIFIDENNINRDIRIINSYEQRKKEGELVKMNFDSKFNENEEQIKNICDIIIDGNPIGFSYFYKFNKIGRHIIKYSFLSNLTKANDLFAHCSSITKLDFAYFSSERITNMDSMFFLCKGLKDLNLLNFNTEKVISMDSMFYGCESLKEVDLSNFNTGNVKYMNSFFSGCKSLTKADLGNFHIDKIENLSFMFCNCNSLSYINLCNYKTKDITYMNNMLDKLKSGKSVKMLIEAIFKLKDLIKELNDLI